MNASSENIASMLFDLPMPGDTHTRQGIWFVSKTYQIQDRSAFPIEMWTYVFLWYLEHWRI